MKAKGDATHLFRCLHENQNAYNEGHERPHKILGLGLGGGMECIRAAAMCRVLDEHGLTHGFTTLVGVSGAGGPLAALLSGTAARSHTVFEYLAVSRFIAWDPYAWAYAMDIDRFERVLMGQETLFGLNARKIRAHPTDLFVTATRADGSKLMLDVKSVEPHPAKAIAASSAVPISCRPVRVGDEDLHDGAFCGDPMPIGSGLECMQLKQGERPKVLVMQSRMHPKYRRMEWWLWPWWVYGAYALQLTPALRANMAYADTQFAATARELAAMQHIDWCRLAPTPSDTTIMPTTTYLPALRQVVSEVSLFMRDMVRATKPSRQI